MVGTLPIGKRIALVSRVFDDSKRSTIPSAKNVIDRSAVIQRHINRGRLGILLIGVERDLPTALAKQCIKVQLPVFARIVTLGNNKLRLPKRRGKARDDLFGELDSLIRALGAVLAIFAQGRHECGWLSDSRRLDVIGSPDRCSRGTRCLTCADGLKRRNKRRIVIDLVHVHERLAQHVLELLKRLTCNGSCYRPAMCAIIAINANDMNRIDNRLVINVANKILVSD